MGPMLPDWVRVAWATGFLVAVAVHLRHVRAGTGQEKWWHAGHAVMAAGMGVMYLAPRTANPVLYRAAAWMFIGVLVAIVGAAAWLRRREGAFNPLWLGSAADTAVMAAMCLAAPARLGNLGLVLAGYLALTAFAWATG